MDVRNGTQASDGVVASRAAGMQAGRIGGLLGDNDKYTRQAALQQACHDLKGEASAEETVKRAETYYRFIVSQA